jgi:hypothetical protein
LHQISVPFFEQRSFNGIESTPENDLEAGDENNDVEALIKKVN